MKNILFSTDGEGRWWKREWKPQCSKRVFIQGRCQGTKGHKGYHWCYGKSGNYEWSCNKDDPTPEDERAAAGSIPPGNEGYINPVDKQDEYHLGFYEDSEVTDPDEIARLEREEMNDGESITRPC